LFKHRNSLRHDLDLALRWANENNAHLPAASTVMQTYENAQKANMGSLDGACLTHFVSSIATRR